MADPKLISLILEGSATWNAWRLNHPDVKIDLSNVDLSRCGLRGVNLENAILRDANFFETNLQNGNLRRSHLSGAEFIATRFDGTIFDGAVLGGTYFENVDFTGTIGLANTEHAAPSKIDLISMRRAGGRVADNFLRGCGLTDAEVLFAKLYDPKLTNDAITTILYEIDRVLGTAPVQLIPIFISYSHRDERFVTYLEHRLQQNGLRCWRDVRDLVAGRIDRQIDSAIRLNSAVILILSRSSLDSDWVVWEVSRARDLEKRTKRPVLCPIALDDSWQTCDWPGPLREQLQQYYIIDFSAWERPQDFASQLDRLLRGLRANYARH